MSLSDDILQANESILNEMLTHRFVEDICADRLPPDVFQRYVAYEGAFVETAISIFAYAVARAPDMEARRWMIGVLDALANEQIPYFEERYQTLDITPLADLPPQAAAFDKGMHELAKQGDFLDIATAMFAAEWMYWSWSKRAIACQISNPDLKAWIALHVDETFAAQAMWLKKAIDRYGSKNDMERLSAIFAKVTRLEVGFHHAPYSSRASGEEGS
ncbi:MAG: TenA family protein [Pseudomonadota bacterium]